MLANGRGRGRSDDKRGTRNVANCQCRGRQFLNTKAPKWRRKACHEILVYTSRDDEMAMQQLGHLELSYPSCSMEGGHTYSKAFFIGGFVSNSINEKYVSEEAAGVKGVKELAQGREVEQGTESYAKEHHGQYDTLSPHTVRGKRVSAQWHPWAAVQIHVKE